MVVKSAVLEKEFIPEFNGNKDLDTKDQIVISIKEHVSNLQLGMYKKFSQDDNGNTSLKYDDLSICRKHIGKIKNLSEGTGEKIIDGIELADSKNKLLYPLLTEIRSYLLNASEVIPEGESEASEVSSDSTQQK